MVLKNLKATPTPRVPISRNRGVEERRKRTMNPRLFEGPEENDFPRGSGGEHRAKIPAL